jgi:hypothetical protein
MIVMKILIISALSAAVLLLLLLYVKRKKAEDVLQKPAEKQPSQQPHQNVELPADAASKIEAIVEEIQADDVKIDTVAEEAVQEESVTVVNELTEPELVPEIDEEQPDESLLTRHRLSNIRMMLANTSSPRPTDSALSRHYDLMMDEEAEKCLTDAVQMERLLRVYENYKKSQSIPEAVISTSAVKPIIPEDSALRRHYVTQLRTTIEAAKAARPTDSALRRHYDAMIDAEMAAHLAVD